MSENLPATDDAARPRLRRVITAILFIMISIMIVRDIFARRWGGPTPPPTNVTERSR